MRILQRESLSQFIPSFLFAVTVLAFVLLMDRLFLLADLLVRKGVSAKVVGEIAFLSIPFVISISAPLGSLIGGVVTFGRMAQDNEITAIKAAGIPTWRIFSPVLMLTIVVVPLMGLFNGFILPESQHQVRNLLTDIARKKPAVRIQERVFMDDFPGYMVYIGALDERRSTIANIIIFEKQHGKKTPSFITAPRGAISYTPDGKYMILTLSDGEIHEITNNGNYRRLTFETHIINLVVDDELIRRGRDYRGGDELLLFQLINQLKEKNQEIKEMSAELSSITAEDFQGAKETAQFRKEELTVRLRYKNLEKARLLTELHKRLSIAFSILFFLLFGAPLGILLRRGGIGTGFIVGLIFFAIYYVLLIGGENFAESGRLSPFLGMWLPNILLTLPVVEFSGRALFEFSPAQWIFSRVIKRR